MAAGDDATIAALYDTMVDRAEEINAAGYPYEAFVNGSNAFAGQLLIGIGLVDPLDPTRADPTAVPALTNSSAQGRRRKRLGRKDAQAGNVA